MSHSELRTCAQQVHRDGVRLALEAVDAVTAAEGRLSHVGVFIDDEARLRLALPT